MKKLIVFVLSILLIASLCACGGDSTEVSVNAAEEQATLVALLVQANETMQPGTAGSSLKAANIAATLLDWCETCTLDENGLIAAAKLFVTNLSEEDLPLFLEQAAQLQETCKLLAEGDASAIGNLADSGYTGESTQWSEDAAERAEIVLDAVKN